MKTDLKSLLFSGTLLIIVAVIPKTGSLFYIHEFILVTNSELSWTEAQTFCRAEYNDLATIANEQEFNAVIDMTVNWTKAFWIGLYNDLNGWRWSMRGGHFYTDLQKDYRQWKKNYPDNAGTGKRCASIMEDGFWRDSGCQFKMPFICFRDGEEDQYEVVITNKTWYEAKKYCQENHTNLVAVRSLVENLMLKSKLLETHGVQEAWIGLHRDTWMWSDGNSSPFRRWRGGWSNAVNGSMVCAAIQNGEWKDWECGIRSNFLCQKMTLITPPAPVTGPTTYTGVSRKRTVIKMKLLTKLDLRNPIMRHKLSEQLQAVIHVRGFTDAKLLLRSVKAELITTERDDCGEEIKKKNIGDI